MPKILLDDDDVTEIELDLDEFFRLMHRELTRTIRAEEKEQGRWRPRRMLARTV